MRGIEAFTDYFECYNRGDLAGVMAHLAPDIEVVLVKYQGREDDWVAVRGAADMRQSYIDSFAKPGYQAVQLTVPVLVEDGELDRVSVSLRDPVLHNDIDVVYVIRRADGLMVQHIISNVRPTAP